MPNHVITNVYMDGDEEDIQEFWDIFGRDTEFMFDFEVLIPMSEDAMNSLKSREPGPAPKWYSWCCNNWGTKWNSYHNRVVDDCSFSFQTAWAHPYPIMKALSRRFPNIQFAVEYADENIGFNFGKYLLEGGNEPLESQSLPTDGTEEAKTFAMAVWNGGVEAALIGLELVIG